MTDTIKGGNEMDNMRWAISCLSVHGYSTDYAVDVGVHTPFWITEKARIFNNVIGFEPDKNSFYPIVHKLKQWQEESLSNGLTKTDEYFYHDNVKMHNVALANYIGTAKFNSCTNNPGLSNLEHVDSRKNPTYDWMESIVSVNKLDNMVRIPEGRTLDYLKIDTEGMDAEILLGGLELVLKYLPLIQIEHDDYGYANNLLYANGYIEIKPTFVTTNRFYVTTPEQRKKNENL